jgi:NitT/TauT family transport system substrate-binding protein
MLLFLVGCSKKQPTAPFRLGFFPNLTHAQALVGYDQTTFAKALAGKKIELKKFNAGPTAMMALMSGELDVTYVGSGPAIQTYVKSKVIRVIAGSASGGAMLVTHTAQSARDLSGKKVATPQLGNSQDIALRYWLKSQGMSAPVQGGGDVLVTPIANPDIFSLFIRKELEGAWVPEPWGARLIAEGGGRIMIDERNLWENGEFPTTILAASEKSLQNRREEIRAILQAHIDLTNQAQKEPKAFARKANQAFGAITGRPLQENILFDAFSRIKWTTDPMSKKLQIAADHAAELGFIPPTNIDPMVDTSLLNSLRRPAPHASW